MKENGDNQEASEQAATSAVDAGPPISSDTTPALKRLGPLPFSDGTFPLMGFFASVYEHISAQASAMLDGSPPPQQ